MAPQSLTFSHYSSHFLQLLSPRWRQRGRRRRRRRRPELFISPSKSELGDNFPFRNRSNLQELARVALAVAAAANYHHFFTGKREMLYAAPARSCANWRIGRWGWGTLTAGATNT